MPQQLPPFIFKRLHDLLFQKFEEICLENNHSIPTQGYQRYGYSEKYDPDKPSLLNFLEENSSVRDFLERINQGKENKESGQFRLNGKFLYDRYLEWEKAGTSSIRISDNYLTVFALFLGYESKEAFLKENIQNNAPVFYLGLYYSYRHRKVLRFHLEFIPGNDGYFIKERGLHDADNASEYSGKGIIRRNCLYIDLNPPPHSERQIKIIAKVNGQKVEAEKIIFCSLLTVSSNYFPVSAHALLIRQEKSDEGGAFSDELNLLQAKRYLYLRRDTFWVEGITVDTPEQLQFKNTAVDQIKFMVGSFRVWWEDAKENLVQSRLIIHDDYEAVLDSKYFKIISDQECIISVSRATNYRICLAFYEKNDRHITAFAIISVPEKERFFQGVFCTVGRPNEETEMRKIVLLKERQGGKSCEPRTIKKERIQQYIKTEDPAELAILWRKLKN